MNKKVSVIIDIDNILWDFLTPFLRNINSTCGMNFTAEDITCWNWWEEHKDIKDRFDELVHKTHSMLDSSKPFPTASEYLNNLRKKGVHIVFCSNRNKTVEETTIQWLKSHCLFYPDTDEAFLDMNFNMSTKEAVIKTVAKRDIPLVAVVDDSPFVISYVLENHPTVNVFSFPYKWLMSDKYSKVSFFKNFRELYMKLIKEITWATQQ